MRLKVARESDALYLRFDESKIVDSEEVTPGVVLDFNEHDEVVGAEIFRLSKRVSLSDISKVSLETV